MLASSAPSANLVVTTTDDVNDSGPCGTIVDSDLPGTDGAVSLREAVCVANNTAAADNITFAVDGEFHLTNTGSGEDNAATGDLDLKDTMNIIGNGRSNTIIDGDGADRVFHIDPNNTCNCTVAISQLRIRDGDVGNGGGILIGNDATVSLSMVALNNNNANNGGGIDNRGTLAVNNVTLAGNSASGEGGAIRNLGTLSLDNSEVHTNTAALGAGVFNNTSGNEAVQISDTDIGENNATDGGGIYTQGDGSFLLTRSAVYSNTATGNGGGIYLDDAALGVTATHSLVNDTISSNTAGMDGGGIYQAGGDATANYLTIVLNEADNDDVGGGQGGGVGVMTGTLVYSNSIILGNRVGDSGSNRSCFGSPASLVSGGYNLVGNTNQCNATATGDTEVANADVATVIDTELRDNGGKSLTHALVEGSPAIDTADPAGCIPTDQRGVTRPQRTGCDRGAFELEGLPTETPTETVTETATETTTSTATETISATVTTTATTTATQTGTVLATGTSTGTATTTQTATGTSTGTSVASSTATQTVVPSSTGTVQATNTTQATNTGTTVPSSTGTSTVTRTSTAIPSATSTACPIQFADVQPGDTFYTFIRCLACRGIVSGYACGGPGEPCNVNNEPYYRPGANVTRGQLSKIVANSAGLNDEIAEGQQQFADVEPGDPFYVFIERLAQTGAIAGYPCGESVPGEPCDDLERPYFRPNNPATRGQISKIVSIAAGFEEDVPAEQQTFTDVPTDSPFWLYIERLANRGIISGYDTEDRCPETGAPCFRYNDNTTRGQMAKIAANAFFPACQTPVRP